MLLSFSTVSPVDRGTHDISGGVGAPLADGRVDLRSWWKNYLAGAWKMHTVIGPERGPIGPERESFKYYKEE